MEQAIMPAVVALVDDVFFQAKLLETARQVGIVLKTVPTGDALLGAIQSHDQNAAPRLIIVDLNARQGAIEVLEKLCAAGNSVPIVAFLSHVQADLAERARAAGCQQVMPRSKLTRDLAAILSQARP